MQDVAAGREPLAVGLSPGAPEVETRALQTSFEYITDWILPGDLQDSLVTAGTEEDRYDFACNCEDAPCNARTIDCSCVIDYGHFYNAKGRLMLDRLSASHAIYECSLLCSCRAMGTCMNAVTQRGVTTRCSLRWTPDRGFGLFAEENIAKGSFLCCYIGEVITSAEARERWKSQLSNQHSNYILMLKEAMTIEGKTEILKTTIDARTKGNLSHFLSETASFHRGTDGAGT